MALSPAFSFDHSAQLPIRFLSVVNGVRISRTDQLLEHFIHRASRGRGTDGHTGCCQRYQLVWPHNTLSLLFVRGQRVPVGSSEALRLYRQQHRSVAEAYQTYLQGQF